MASRMQWLSDDSERIVDLGLVTLDQAATRIVDGIKASQVAELIGLLSPRMMEAVRRVVRESPTTDAEWDAKVIVTTGGIRHANELRIQQRMAVEAFREKFANDE